MFGAGLRKQSRFGAPCPGRRCADLQLKVLKVGSADGSEPGPVRAGRRGDLEQLRHRSGRRRRPTKVGGNKKKKEEKNTPLSNESPDGNKRPVMNHRGHSRHLKKRTAGCLCPGPHCSRSSTLNLCLSQHGMRGHCVRVCVCERKSFVIFKVTLEVFSYSQRGV